MHFDLSDEKITIKIPISDLDELYAYQKSLLRLLEKVEIDGIDEAFKEDLKRYYRVLGHFFPEQSTADNLERLRFLLNKK